MNLRKTFESKAKASELVQPSDRAFDYPAGLAEAAAVFGESPSDLTANSALCQQPAQGIGVVAAISLNEPGLTDRGSAPAGNRGHGVEQRQQLGYVVAVGLGEHYRKGNALRVREEVVLAARTTAIGWVRSSFFPAPTARMEELSAMARRKSMRSASRSFASNTWCNRFHTRARCQARSRRQQVIPEPQPISCGSIFHGMPDFRTNKMPVSACRSESRCRPGFRLRRRRLGSSGSITVHSSSSISGFGIAEPHVNAMPYRTAAPS